MAITYAPGPCHVHVIVSCGNEEYIFLKYIYSIDIYTHLKYVIFNPCDSGDVYNTVKYLSSMFNRRSLNHFAGFLQQSRLKLVLFHLGVRALLRTPIIKI